MNTLLRIAIVFLLFSCDPNVIYESHSDPSGNLEWSPSTVMKYDVSINDISIKYDLILALRIATGYAFSTCDVEVRMKSPSGKVEIWKHQIQTRDETGYKGEGAGDIFDIEEVLAGEYEFPEAGNYTFEISHLMPTERLHMVMEVGMIVRKSAVSPT